MLITRTPLRISIGGGGTDLPSFYERRGGFVISAAIDKHVYVALNRTYYEGYWIRYSESEKVSHVDEIRHNIVREVFRRHDVPARTEMVSVADIPAGTGLGSSGTFTVGLLRAAYALNREHISPAALAEEAADLEINVLGEPVGKQDQYIASFGGLTCFEFHADGRVTTSALAIDRPTLHDLEERLLLFFTGYSRSAGSILSDQHEKSKQDDAAMLENLERTKASGLEIRRVLEGGEPEAFGRLMHEHWVRKRARSAGMSNERIDQAYAAARDNGALGGKLVGAGSGGFLMFYAEDPGRVRKAMVEQGLQEARFQFEFAGATVLVSN